MATREQNITTIKEFDERYKKTVKYSYRGYNLYFHVSQDLFSSQKVDTGTHFLLKTLITEGCDNYSKVLDLGSGYGPIGIVLKNVNPLSIVHMVDRDALALEYSRQNSRLNEVSTEVYGSVGYDQVPDTDFDLIVSNVPAKVGEPVLAYILNEAQYYLRPKGRVAVVVIDAIADYVSKVVSGMNVNILFQRRTPGYLVLHYEFPQNTAVNRKPTESAFERGIYNREEKEFSTNNRVIYITTAYGLSEFDTLSYETQLILEGLSILEGKQINKAMIFNPNQGVIPVFLTQSTKVNEIVLIDRNLFTLEVSKRNIIKNNFPENMISRLHQVDIKTSDNTKADSIIGVLDDRTSSAIHAIYLKQAAEQLLPNGIIIFASGSTNITRLEKVVKSLKSLDIVKRRKFKGKSAITLKKR